MQVVGSLRILSSNMQQSAPAVQALVGACSRALPEAVQGTFNTDCMAIHTSFTSGGDDACVTILNRHLPCLQRFGNCRHNRWARSSRHSNWSPALLYPSQHLVHWQELR